VWLQPGTLRLRAWWWLPSMCRPTLSVRAYAGVSCYVRVYGSLLLPRRRCGARLARSSTLRLCRTDSLSSSFSSLISRARCLVLPRFWPLIRPLSFLYREDRSCRSTSCADSTAVIRPTKSALSMWFFSLSVLIRSARSSTRSVSRS